MKLYKLVGEHIKLLEQYIKQAIEHMKLFKLEHTKLIKLEHMK